MMSYRSKYLSASFVLLTLFVTAISAFANSHPNPVDRDQISRVLACANGVQCALDAVFVVDVQSPYIFVSVPYGGADRPVLPVYTGSWKIGKNWTLNISGVTASAGDKKVLLARSIQAFVDAKGRECCVPMPFSSADWPYFKNCTQFQAAAADAQEAPLPPVPATGTPTTPEPLTAETGTIAYAKLQGGSVELDGKVVTAVFANAANTYLDYIYIQEPETGGRGIKVVLPAETYTISDIIPGYVVDVEGTVVSTGLAECHVAADAVIYVSSRIRPKPAGMNERSAASGSFGLQPALYARTSDSSPCGGLNAVGTRVRLWGKVTYLSTDGSQCCIDDGSGLESTVGGSTRSGIRIIGRADCPMNYAIGSYVGGITGVLGAEMCDSKPVPVLRVMSSDIFPIIHVSKSGSDNNSGFDWTYAKASLSAAVSSARDGQEIWVAKGIYFENRPPVPEGVSLYGGFAGTENDRNSRDWRRNESVIHITYYGMSAPSVADGFTFICSGPALNCSGAGSVIIAHNNFDHCLTGISINTLDATQPIEITNNIFTDNGTGVSCWDNSGQGLITNESVAIANNTFINDAAGDPSGIAIDLTDASPSVANNIIVKYSYGIRDEGQTGLPSVQNNCWYQTGTPYLLNASCTMSGNISSDPLLVGVHIASNSPCRNNGSNSDVINGETDYDGQARIYNDPLVNDDIVDMGAYESTGCTLTKIVMSPDNATAPPPSSAVFTATVTNAVTADIISGQQVNFSVKHGVITAVNGNALATPSATAEAATDSNGSVAVIVLADSGKTAIVRAAIPISSMDETYAESVLFGGVFKVGFLYDLCTSTDNTKDMIAGYLANLAGEYSNCIVYQAVPVPSQGQYIDASFNTVFLAMPETSVAQPVIDALIQFVQSGRNKRVVLAGEHNNSYEYYQVFNEHLNAVCETLGMGTRFSTTQAVFNIGRDTNRFCPVETEHYLMQGVLCLWNAAAVEFADGWQNCGHPLTYLVRDPNTDIYYRTNPWLMEEDTATAGSRIAIHDSSFFDSDYSDSNDRTPDKNFRFTRNLCTIFPD